MEKLEQLAEETRRAERPPFDSWYKPTWIRRHDSLTNVHYSLNRLRDDVVSLYDDVLASKGTAKDVCEQQPLVTFGNPIRTAH